MTETKTSRKDKIILAASLLLAVAFLASGATKLAGFESHAEHFASWGFPLWFMYLVGATEVIGAALLLSNKTRFIAASVLASTMVGAVGTHVVAGELAQTPPAAILLIATAAIAYATRDQLNRLIARLPINNRR